MITTLRLQNFKSWRDTGDVSLAPLTALFGTNSSGKTSLIQLLLMLKQTTESADRSRVMHTGDSRTYVDIGTFHDVIFMHREDESLAYQLDWRLPKPLRVEFHDQSESTHEIEQLRFEATIDSVEGRASLQRFIYQFNNHRFGMERERRNGRGHMNDQYVLIAELFDLRRNRGRPASLPGPVKSYGFPDQVNASFQNVGFLSDLVLAFEELFQNTYYLGPLREYPSRQYVWAGEQPRDVGRRGELAIPALLASQRWGKVIDPGKYQRKQTVEQRVAHWLKQLGLIESFALNPIAENRKDYEVRVTRSPHSAEVLITDVGFGVSQVLPVLVLCYYAPKGATLILEQPEIHLHPSVQAGLADVFIDAILTRDVQIILESHSEHLLRRLQRRVAERKLDPSQASLYFTTVADDGASELEKLELDLFGNIHNWPRGFFGDDLGELVAMTEAAIKVQEESLAAHASHS